MKEKESELLIRLNGELTNKLLYETTISEQQQLIDSDLAKLKQIQEADSLKQKTMTTQAAEAYAKDQQTNVYSLNKRVEGCKSVITNSQNEIEKINVNINKYQAAIESEKNLAGAKTQNNIAIYKELHQQFKNTTEADFDNLSTEEQDQFVDYSLLKETLEKAGVDLSGDTN